MKKDVEKSYYERVKNYIALQPHSGKINVSAFTGVPIDVVNKFIKEGKFEEHNGILRIARKKSMSKEDRSTVIRSFAEREFRERVHYDVPPLNSENDYIESDSKLVNDLRKRYGIKNVNDDRTR